MTSSPYLFDEFFASGREETISPFLTPSSRGFGKNLPLKSAIFSAFILAASFASSFFYPQAAYLLLIPVYFFAGTPALIGALEDLKNFEINIDVLMTLAALLSVLIGSGMEGALLLVLFELSAAMESTVTQKTKGALLQLHQLTPKVACVIDSQGVLFEKNVKEIAMGTEILVKAGEIVPLDGQIVRGTSFVNLVHLTGESEPVSKRPLDEVQAGARNLEGTFTLKVTRTSRDSTLARMIQLITQAQEAKPRLERFFDRFSKGYATTIILLAFGFALTIPWIFSIPYLGTEGGIYRALTFLIAASPCALIIATPTAYLSAINSCARRGIVLKGGVILDALSRCSTIAFDKTGTLTTGNLVCQSIEILTKKKPICEPDTALAIAAGLEQSAVHPIALAICSFAKERSVLPSSVDQFKAVAGFGLEGIAEVGQTSTRVFIGHPDYISLSIPQTLSEEWRQLQDRLHQEEGLKTILLIGDTLFAFRFIDALRPQIVSILERLKQDQKLKLMMLTGDHIANAQQVASVLPLDEVFANLRPEDKLNKVAELSQKNGLVMVGDGINDAPALARATVGISMGKIGSATAVDASDIVFLQDDLSLLGWLIDKSHHTLRIIKQNLFLALAVILFATTPALLGLVPLWMAVILHEGGTVLVGLNSLRLLKTR